MSLLYPSDLTKHERFVCIAMTKTSVVLSDRQFRLRGVWGREANLVHVNAIAAMLGLRLVRCVTNGARKFIEIELTDAGRSMAKRCAAHALLKDRRA